MRTLVAHNRCPLQRFWRAVVTYRGSNYEYREWGRDHRHDHPNLGPLTSALKSQGAVGLAEFEALDFEPVAMGGQERAFGLVGFFELVEDVVEDLSDV